MKTQSEFAQLKQENFKSKVHPDHLFFAMWDMQENGHLRSVVYRLEEFFWNIPDMLYCIALNTLAIKHNRRTFKGKLVYATKQNLRDFLFLLEANGELKDYVIAPVFETEPPFVGAISKVGHCCMFTKYL